jgi:hypothetical protein
MKKLILPLIVFAIGLVVAQVYFKVNVEELFRGFGTFIVNILKGANR